MKIRTASEHFIKAARLLSEDDAELVLSRMKDKLASRLSKQKLERIQAMAIQLEIESRMLDEWRSHFAELAQEKAITAT